MLPTELPFGPAPRPRGGTLSRVVAQDAAAAALSSPVGEAWEMPTVAWKFSANQLELELEACTGVAV
eukprot:670443-Pyramimonas_sp.AAC.1